MPERFVTTRMNNVRDSARLIVLFTRVPVMRNLGSRPVACATVSPVSALVPLLRKGRCRIGALYLRKYSGLPRPEADVSNRSPGTFRETRMLII